MDVAEKIKNETPGDYWGLLASIDLKDCHPELIRNRAAIVKFAKDLCVFIDMRPFGHPQVVHFGEDDRVAGFSLIQLIQTSLISAHFANATSTAYVDIFSCKEFDAEKAAKFCAHYFKSPKYHISLLYRD